MPTVLGLWKQQCHPTLASVCREIPVLPLTADGQFLTHSWSRRDKPWACSAPALSQPGSSSAEMPLVQCHAPVNPCSRETEGLWQQGWGVSLAFGHIMPTISSTVHLCTSRGESPTACLQSHSQLLMSVWWQSSRVPVGVSCAAQRVEKGCPKSPCRSV